MPNKFSHASVLSNYEACGLTTFNGSRLTQYRPRHATTLKKPLTTNDDSTSQQYCLADPPSTSLQRLRLDSPSPPPRSTHDFDEHPHKRTDTNFTVVTQIYAPEAPSSSTDSAVKDGRDVWTEDDHGAANGYSSPPLSWAVDSRQPTEVHAQLSSHASYPATTSADDRTHVELDGRDGRGLCSPRPQGNVQRRQPNETAIFSTDVLSTPPPTANRRSSNEGSSPGYFRRPPSPPLTPEDRQSFSLDTSFDTVRSIPIGLAPQPSAPVPGRSGRPLSSPTALAKSATVSQLSSNVPRPKTSTGATLKRSSKIFQDSTRISSLKATALDRSDSDDSPASSSFGLPPYADESNVAGDFFVEPLFAELESLPRFSAGFRDSDLPTELPSDLDYDALPWEDVNCNDSIPSALRRLSSPLISTRTSFDSVAPPPISLSRFNESSSRSKLRGPMPDRSKPGTHPTIQKSQIPGAQMLSQKSLSSIFPRRSPNPISVPYQTTTPGKQPAHVSVSRTSVPSIPTLFPKYKGSWPPDKTPAAVGDGGDEQKASSISVNSVRTSWNAFSAATAGRVPGKPNSTAPSAVAPPASTFRQNGPAPKASVSVPSRILSEGPAPLAQVAPQPRGKSVGPATVGLGRPGSAETKQRRKSWFNTDTLDRTFGERERRVGRRRERGSEIAPGLM